jgi:hypothetical protein
LRAGISEAREFDDRCWADGQPGTDGVAEQIEAPRGNVFAEIARNDRKPANRELGEEFCVNQMHLPQVRLRRISADTGEMLNGPPRMCVPLDAVTNAEADARECRFAERVTITPTDRVNYSVHLRRPD